MNTLRILLLMCFLSTSTIFHLYAQTVDLEVTMATSNPNPALYNHVPVTYTLHNKGTVAATNIRVQIGACDPINNENELFYGDRVQLVYSSSAQPTTNLGTYERTNQGWEIPELAAGSKATLTVTFFTLTEEERTLLAFVTLVDQTDSDSSPAFLQDCTPLEDDEAALVLNDAGGGNGDCQWSISNVTFPSTISPGQAVNVQARVTNNSTTAASIPAQLNVYQFVTIGSIPGATLVQAGASVPNLAPGASTMVQFTFNVPSPLYVNSIFPIEDEVRLDDLYLIIDNDVQNGSTAYLGCNHLLEFDIDYPNIDLELSWEDNDGCYGNDRIIQTDLRLTNKSNQATNAPIYVALGQTGFINLPNPQIVSGFRTGLSYWKIEQPIAAGGSVVLNRPYKAPNSTNGEVNLSPEILTEPSNIDDPNLNNNQLNYFFDYRTNCGGNEQIPASIFAVAFNDINEDGVRIFQDGDRGINNLRVRVENRSGQVIQEAFTSASGLVSLSRLIPPGEYRVVFDVPTNSRSTLKNATQGTEDTDSDINPNGKTDYFTLDFGETINIGGGFVMNDVEPQVDIELSGTTPTTDVGIYQRFPVTFTVTNNGNSIATNLVINTGVCTGNTIGIGNNTSFNNANGVVLSSPPASTTLGTYSAVSRRWRIGTLEPGQTAILEINLFTLTDEERKIIAHLVVANESDVDSTPGNWTTCTPNEDDEAAIIINGSGTGGGKPDFIFSAIGYIAYGDNTATVQEGSTVPVGTLISIPFHNITGKSPIFNANYPNKTKIYLSRDQVVDAQDAVLLDLDLELRSLGTDVFREGDLGTFSIPTTTPLGVYHLIAKVDADEEVAETDESNNTLIMPIYIVADPEPKFDFDFRAIGYFTAQSAPPYNFIPIESGTEIPAGVDLTIISHFIDGYSPVPGARYDTKIKTYLSIDGVITPDDILIANEDYTVTASGTSFFREGELYGLTIPVNTPAGNYNIITVVNEDNEVPEVNKSNNTVVTRGVTILAINCPCPQVYNPVCGSDGVTYNNACLAACAGITDYTPGECDECICPQVVDPVCGSDGVTYGNACLAACAGITDYTSGACPIGTDGVDLELEIIAPATYAIYTKVLFQARIENTGTVNAEGVKVDFKIPAGFVHSSNSASVGNYDLYREEWNVGTLKAGTSAVLDLTLFALGTDEVIAYAQVSACQQNDVDSTPANGSCCVADEDDEAVATVVSSFKNTGNTGALRSTNIHTDLQIKSLYPTIATDEINLFVQSKLSELHLTIYNLQGEPVLEKYYSETTGFQRLQIDVDNLPTGMYLVRFEGTAGKETVRFIKMQM